MKKTILGMVGIVSIFIFSGCATSTVDPQVIAQGDYGPYPTNYKKIARSAWQGTIEKGKIYPDTIKTSKPIKAYTRDDSGKPDFFGYFIRTCATYKDGRTKNCWKFIIKKRSCVRYPGRTQKEYENGGCHKPLNYNTFHAYSEPWYQKQEHDVN